VHRGWIAACIILCWPLAIAAVLAANRAARALGAGDLFTAHREAHQARSRAQTGTLARPEGPGPSPAADRGSAAGPYDPPRSPYDAPLAFQAVARPPAEPSTGEGWSIVALLAWWPFGIAAYPHTQRATAALAAGDRPSAAAHGARARRIGIAGLVFSIALPVGLLSGIVALAYWLEDVAQATDAATSTRYVDDDQPGSGPVDGTPVRELQEGSCYLTDGLTDVVRTVAVVQCAEPHGGELYGFAYVPGDEFAPTDGLTEPPYPGPAPVARYAADACRAAFETATGTSAQQSGLPFWHIAPDPWDWRSLDRRIACFAESDADDVTGRVGGR
jgi:hypothetical protein